MMDESRRARRENSYRNHRAVSGIIDQLVAIRKARGLTQEQLGDLMGVSQSYVSQIENGNTGMFDNLLDYAFAVGARLDLNAVMSEDAFERPVLATWEVPSGSEVSVLSLKESQIPSSVLDSFSGTSSVNFFMVN